MANSQEIKNRSDYENAVIKWTEDLMDLADPESIHDKLTDVILLCAGEESCNIHNEISTLHALLMHLRCLRPLNKYYQTI